MPRATRPTLLLVIALAGACADVPRRPLDPDAIERELAARTLADPALRDLCVQELGQPAAPWPPAELDVATLTLAAWRFRPELDRARAEVAVAEAKVTTAGTPPNPSLTLQPGRIVDPSRSPWFFGVALDFVIPTAGKLGKQAAVASAAVDLARLAAAESAWRVYAEVRDAAIAAAFAARELALAQRDAELQAAFAAQLEARVRAGAAAGHESLAAVLGADRARAEVARMTAEEVRARAQLAVAAGVAPAELARAAVALPARDDNDGDDDHADDAGDDHFGLLDRLDLRRGLLDYEAAERTLELELARQYPDLRLGPGWEYDQGERKFLLGVGVDLPLFDRNQGPIAEAVARRDAVAATFRESEAAALAAIGVARAELAAAKERLAQFDEAGRARLAARRDAAERAFAAGASDRTALLQVELERIAFDLARLAAERARLVAQAHFEDALQRPLDPRLAALAPDRPAPPAADSVKDSR